MVSVWIDMSFAEACAACGLSEFMLMMFENLKAAHKLFEKNAARIFPIKKEHGRFTMLFR